LQEGLREVVACFPVYRSYVTADGHDSYDKRVVEAAVADALRRNPALEPSMFSFIRAMLLPQRSSDLSEEDYERRIRFAMKFQQYTGPVQAKGVEDTAFYRFAPLASLNEVGGEPSRFGRTTEEFHIANQQRREQWPLSMLSTATHDTKRGEDARCRISVLSEIPEEFRKALFRWTRGNAGLKKSVHGSAAPDRADEYLYYQALLGAWPPELHDLPQDEFVNRMQSYMLKAIKEEKIHSSWIHPSHEYDEAMSGFVRRTLSGHAGKRFLRSFLPFQQRVARAGMVNSLGQLVLKVVSPGVPDFYQGTEIWDLNLVDPDNRRAVDFSARAAMLQEMQPLLEENLSVDERKEKLQGLIQDWPSGKLKLLCTAILLNLRRRLKDLCLFGEYVPFATNGPERDHVLALGRLNEYDAVIAIVPRLSARLTETDKPLPVGVNSWRDTAVELPSAFRGRRYRDLLTGEIHEGQERLMLRNHLSTLPFSVLVAQH
jgi:(1->4)-alpha-D-glucan 1-alpha-D-glucosylmutase